MKTYIKFTTNKDCLDNSFVELEGFKYSPIAKTIYIDPIQDSLSLKESAFKAGKYVQKKLKSTIKLIDDEIDYSILLSLYQSYVSPKETVKDLNSLNSTVTDKDMVKIPVNKDIKIKVDEYSVEVKHYDFILLNRYLSDLKRFVNTPHNQMSLNDLKDTIVNYLNQNTRTSVKVLDSSYLKENGYNLITAIDNNASIIHASYKPKTTLLKIALVGKGVHFDTGGYSLKPSDSMIDMKRDKTGAITAMMMYILAVKLNLPVEIDLIVGLAENLLSPNGYKPGDVLKSKNHKTIEVINTDAEGRLLLADCLNYLSTLDKDFNRIITIATLTGAAMRAVSKYTTAEHGSQTFYNNALDITGDVVCNLKPHPKLKDTLKSKIADLRNVASTDEAGSITAYLFLKEFVPDIPRLQYSHLDIAGPSYTDKLFGYTNYGATGILLETFFIDALLNYL